MLTITNTTTLQDLHAESMEHDTHKADHKDSARAFSFDEGARLIVPANLFGVNASLPALAPTNWAWKQIFSKLGPAVFGKGTNKTLPPEYLLAMDPKLRAHVLNDHVRRSDGTWLVRAYDDTCRAVVSDKYTPISNTEILETLNRISNGTPQEHSIVRSSTVTPDSLNVKIIWKNVTKPDDGRGNGSWGVGVYIGNGETGNRRLRMRPLIQRHSCQNSIIGDSDKTSLDFVHVGSSVAKMALIKSAMIEILPVAAQLLETMIEADNERIPDFSDVLYVLSKQYNWSDETRVHIAVGTEGRETRAGLVNGITYAAQRVENPDDRVDMEIVGGAILVAPDSVFSKAADVMKR